MECNRDESLRAKEVAEQKFAAKDFVGARKFALKAHNLFPELEGINQMIATMDIYLAAEVKINGESDWYSVLSVNALADEETVKKQYRKLALQHHPDKNKSIGSEGAFKLISQAWSVLSDKSRKLLYDQKRSATTVQKRAPQPKRDTSGSVNGFYNFANNTSYVKPRKRKSSAAKSTASAAAAAACPSNPTTFWTSCNRCRMQYEYLRVYLNHNLLCPNCHEAFLAVETGFPTNRPGSVSANHQARQKLNDKSTMNNAYGHTVPGMTNMSFQHGDNVDAYDNPNFQHAAYSRTVGAASASASTSAAAHAANLVHQTYEKVRREREEAQATARREDAALKKNHISKANGSGPSVGRPPKRSRGMGVDISTYFKVKETESSGYKVSSTERHANYDMGYGMANVNGGFVDPNTTRAKIKQYILSREFAQIDLRNILLAKSKSNVSSKLKEWDSAAAAKLVDQEKAKQTQEMQENGIGKAAANVDEKACDQNMSNDSRMNAKHFPVTKISKNSTGVIKEVVQNQHVTIDVPDPDFMEFDKDRSEGCFEADQVWASYDNEDGMPRFYALVQKVISLKPFKIRMCFLTSKSNSELGPLNWVGSGFAKTCGDFRISRYEIGETVNIFSHRVKSERISRGVVRIIPRKGDTWALYRNWSPDWNEHTPDDLVYKYEMVEVLDEYNEEQGVTVTPLVKVTGFKTVFHRHMDPKEVKRIPKEEMFRFSHQVPSYLLTGAEAQNAPKGCRELDPAATPLELLQVITEVNEDLMVTGEQQNIS